MSYEQFCTNCGQQLFLKCKCGKEVDYSEKFCGNCGEENPIYFNKQLSNEFKYCIICGHKIPTVSKFCTICGKKQE